MTDQKQFKQKVTDYRQTDRLTERQTTAQSGNPLALLTFGHGAANK